MKQDYTGETVPLAYHEMCLSRADRRLFWAFIGWAVSLIAAVGLFVFMWLQYDYSSSFSADVEGVYNLVDADGNVISTDLTAEDVITLMEAIKRGENTGAGQADAD